MLAKWQTQLHLMETSLYMYDIDSLTKFFEIVQLDTKQAQEIAKRSHSKPKAETKQHNKRKNNKTNKNS